MHEETTVLDVYNSFLNLQSYTVGAKLFALFYTLPENVAHLRHCVHISKKWKKTHFDNRFFTVSILFVF